MNQSNIKEILRKHELWLAGEKEGVRADLRGVDLSGADLSGANLTASRKDKQEEA